MAIKKSIYDSANRILTNKGKWANAKANNQDVTPYAKAAQNDYAYLRANGASDIADRLESLDYSGASEYLSGLEVEGDNIDYSNWMNGIQDKSNATFESAMSDKDTLLKDYNDYFDYLKEGYAGKDYANTILNSYNEQGQNAILGELASVGAENAGNIDSYAKAQAQRQQLAFQNAGNAAALDQYNAIMGNYLAGLEGKKGAATDFLDRMQGNVNSDYEAYTNLWNTDLSAAQAEADSLRNYQAMIAATEAEREATLAQIQAAQAQADADRAWEKEKYQIDANAAIETAKQNALTAQNKAQTEAQAAAETQFWKMYSDYLSANNENPPSETWQAWAQLLGLDVRSLGEPEGGPEPIESDWANITEFVSAFENASHDQRDYDAFVKENAEYLMGNKPFSDGSYVTNDVRSSIYGKTSTPPQGSPEPYTPLPEPEGERSEQYEYVYNMASKMKNPYYLPRFLENRVSIGQISPEEAYAMTVELLEKLGYAYDSEGNVVIKKNPVNTPGRGGGGGGPYLNKDFQ